MAEELEIDYEPQDILPWWLEKRWPTKQEQEELTTHEWAYIYGFRNEYELYGL